MKGNQSGLASPRIILAIILVVAFLLRLPGFFYGLSIFDPHAQIYHPDEGKIVEGAALFPDDAFTRNDLRYPTGLHYLGGILLQPVESLIAFDLIPKTQYEMLAYVVVRLVNIFFAVGAVALVYLFGKRVYDRRVGLLAAAFLALALYHVRNASMATTDVGTSFWLVVVLLFAYRLTPQSSKGEYIELGAAMGMLVGTKYSGAIAVLPVGLVLLSLFWQAQDADQRRWVFGYGLLIAFTAIIVFLLTTPTIFFNSDALFTSLAYESGRVGGERLPIWDLSPLVTDVRRLWDVVGLPLASLMILGLFLGVSRREAGKSLPLVLLVVGYLLFFWGSMINRYFILIMPVLSLLAARFAVSLFKWELPLFRWAVSGFLVITFAYSFGYSVGGIALLFNDTRSRASAYIEEHIPPGSSIGYEYIGETFRGRWTLPYVNPDRYELIDNLEHPQYVILTSLRFQQFEAALASDKLSEGYSWDPNFADEWYRGQVPAPEVFRFYDQVLNGNGEIYNYRLIAVFERDIWVPIEFPPPEIRIYRRVDS